MTTIIRVVDLETTGTEPPAAVCEIGTADLCGSGVDWQVADWLGTLVDPRSPIPPEVSAIHHIVDEDVVGALRWEFASHRTVTSHRDDGLCPSVLAAHNAAFERRWITDEIAGGLPWICTYKAALRLWPDAPGHGNQALRYWLKPPGLDREVAAVAHRATPDAYVTAHVLRMCLQIASVEELIAWTAEPAMLPRCPVGKWRGKPWSEVDAGFLRWMLDKDFGDDVKHCARLELERRSGARSRPRRRRA